MFFVSHDDKRFVKEDLFGFPEGYAMELPVLLEIPIVPIEPSTALERVVRHRVKYMSEVYAKATASGGLTCIRLPNAGSKPDKSCNLTPLCFSSENRLKPFYAGDFSTAELVLAEEVREQKLQPNSLPSSKDARS
jgi:hypothetical protein